MIKKIRLQTLLIIGGIFILASCQKELSFETEPEVTNPALLGVWAFASLEVKAVYDLTITDGIDTARTVTTSHYFSKNNVGLLTIEPSSMSLEYYSFSVDTTVKSKYYENGELLSEFELPFQTELPPSSSEMPSYRLIGVDSIYFPSGSVLTMDAGATTLPTEPSGIRYKLDGDRLTLITPITLNTKETDQDGITTIKKVDGLQTAVFQKP